MKKKNDNIDARNLIAQLEHQKEVIDNALAALTALNGAVRPKMRRGGRKKMSAEARKRISLAQKKRWKEQKTKAEA